MGRVIRLVLPYPISANDFKQAFVPKGKKKPIYYLTKEAKAWQEAAGWIAKQAGFREPITKPVALHLVLMHKSEVWSEQHKRMIRNGHIFDLDNVLKVSIDGLKGIVYADDRQVKRIVAEYGAETPAGALVLEVEEFVPPNAPLFADLPMPAPSQLRPPITKRDPGGLPF